MRSLISSLVAFFFLVSVSVAHDPTARPTKKITQHTKGGSLSPQEVTLLRQVEPTQRNAFQHANPHQQLLSMIIRSNGQFVAYLGKKTVRVGDTVGTMTVQAITLHSVTLSNRSETITLHLSGAHTDSDAPNAD